MKKNYFKSNYQIWLKLQRKIRSVDKRIDETCCEFTKDRLLKRLEILIKRLFNLNRKWRLGIATAAIFLWLGNNNIQAQEVINFADMDSTKGFSLVSDNPGWNRETAFGDFNGDGKDDLVFSSYNNDGQILFGANAPESSVINFNDFDGTDGFTAQTNTENYDVTLVDVNADGFDDIVIGQQYAGAFDGGRNYVLFGHDGTQDAIVDLENPGANQLMNIYSSEIAYRSGYAVFNAGDINGDGFDDLYTVAYDYGYHGNVIFANNIQPASIDLSTEMDASKGIAIKNPTIQFYKGDFNGDGKGDIVTKNTAYHKVLFGQDAGVLDSVDFVGKPDLYDGTTGFKISTWANNDYLKLVDGVLDFNNDGYDDILIRKLKSSLPNYGNDSLFVVYGNPNPDPTVYLDWSGSPINGADVMSIGGLATGELLNSVTTLDFNKDGFSDILISTKTNNEIYLIYGNNNETVSIDVTNLQASQGFRITDFNDNALAVHKAGDLNADGFDDIVVLDSVLVDATDKVVAHIIYGQETTNSVYTVSELQSNGGYDVVFDESINYINNDYNTNYYFNVDNPDFNGDGYEDAVLAILDAGSSSFKFLLSEDNCISDNITEEVSVCSGDNHTYPDGTTATNITVNTSHLSTFISQLTGCDSLITTNIAVNEVHATTKEVNVCSGEDHTYPDGSTEANITANTSHLSSFVSQLTGCDSTITTNITVNEVYATTEEVSVCEGEEYTYPDGTTETGISANTTHESVLTSALTGCDSIVTTNITVNPMQASTEEINICEGEEYTYPDGTTETGITANTTHESVLTSALT
jgi:hypothetical protein